MGKLYCIRYIFFFWFASLSVFKPRLMNFFRIKCTYAEANYVQIEKREPRKFSIFLLLIYNVLH